MTPERWQTIKDVLATVLEMEPSERPAYLEKSCQHDGDLRREVELLLRDEEKASIGFLNQTTLAELAADVLPEENSPWIGRRVGSYQIVQQIGAGGMGEVYRAVRADDQYRQEVALKVVRAGQDSGQVIQRFRNERQILASLEHPNIARLLDGGTTDEGLPYLVMEMIEGRPIGEYCDSHELSIPDRLRLFIQVCSAVQYAHQRLIIHRDIKPSNVLVTPDGTPKLLDFGIAKVLGADLPGQPEHTLTAYRMLTPGYASPEQIKDEAMTTASDVYSLGVVLYELLTGSSPYRATTRRPQELALAICQREPEKPSLAVSRRPTGKYAAPSSSIEQVAAARQTSPSKLGKQLAGDLDNIILMALRKEPFRRYASAEQFGADLRRHLDSVPVVARRDTSAYRVSKFVSRHKAGVAGSVAATLAILAGLAFALHEARVAREQARLAEAQRVRAERRFNDVRKLANSLMFEIHDSIRDLPGAIPARTLLVHRAVEYLDNLSQEASGDAALQRELAAAYDRVGDVLGYEGAANIGDYSGAIQNYNKALAIRESAAAANPNNVQIQSDLLSDYFRLSFALQSAGDSEHALADLQKALPIAQRLAASSNDPKYQDWYAGFRWQTGNILNRSGDYAGALKEYHLAASIREPIALKPGASTLIRTHLAGDYNGIGQMLWRTGQIAPALESSRKAVRILEELSGADPNNATLQEYLAESYGLLQGVLQKHGDLDESFAYARKANTIFVKLASADPANQLARANVGFSEIDLGIALALKGRTGEAASYIRRAMKLFEAQGHPTRYDIAGRAESYSALAKIQETQARNESSPRAKAAYLREARRLLEKSVATWEQDPKHGSPDALGGHAGDDARQELTQCTSALAKLTK